MSKKVVDKLFESLYELTDFRQILRETAPEHELDGERRERALEILDKVKKNLDEIEEEI